MLWSSGHGFDQVLDGLSLAQISIVAECISIARIEFVQKVVMEPIVSLVAGVFKSEPTTNASRKKTTKKAKAKDKKDAHQRAVERDARNAALAAQMGIPIR